MSCRCARQLFIRLAVAMCLVSSTFRGRPNLVPLARDAPSGGRLARLTLLVLAKQVSFLNICGPVQPVRGIIGTDQVEESDIPVSQANPSSRRSDTG